MDSRSNYLRMCSLFLMRVHLSAGFPVACPGLAIQAASFLRSVDAPGCSGGYSEAPSAHRRSLLHGQGGLPAPLSALLPTVRKSSRTVPQQPPAPVSLGSLCTPCVHVPPQRCLAGVTNSEASLQAAQGFITKLLFNSRALWEQCVSRCMQSPPCANGRLLRGVGQKAALSVQLVTCLCRHTGWGLSFVCSGKDTKELSVGL